MVGKGCCSRDGDLFYEVGWKDLDAVIDQGA
jgi:hypothetical protein